MSEHIKEYGVLIAVDGSPESDSATRWAGREAVLRGVPITLMHIVVPVEVNWPVGNLQANFSQWQDENAQNVIGQAQKILLTEFDIAKLPTVRTEVRHGHRIPELVRASENAQVIALGSRGMGAIEGALLGSVSNGVLHHAHCPVAVIHAHEAHASDNTSPVLLGIDGSPASEAATAVAFDEAQRRGVELVALHAWSDVGVLPVFGMNWREYEDEGHALLGQRLAGWHEQFPDVHVNRRIVCDKPARWLIEESQQAQLVVVGSHGRGGFTGMLLGSVSTAVAQHAKCPALIVRGPNKEDEK